MKIETNAYRIAPLPDEAAVLAIIREAEDRLARATGSDITLIAYTKEDEAAARNE